MISFLKKETQPHVCPKTGKIINSVHNKRWAWWLFPFTGLAALIWFLVRVIPKPSRSAYPCQRLAFPLASGFIAWLAGLAVSTIAFHKAKRHLVRARYVLAAVCIVISVASIYIALSYSSQDKVLAAYGTPPFRTPQQVNAPIGTAKGIHPGRVAWIHDPNATNWGGTSDGYWWEPNHTSQAVIDEMVSKSIRAITGENTDYAAWDAIFRYYNNQHGKGNIGYQAGEKIIIKVNFVGFYYSNTNYTTHSNYPNTSPQVIHAVLDQLVNIVGVNDHDITVGDTVDIFVNDFYNTLHSDFPDVNYLDYLGTSGRVKATPSSARVYWSDPNSAGKTADYVPDYFKNAAYLINLATLKGHYNQAGITLCGKNHYGSLARIPTQSGYYDLHSTQVWTVWGMGHYRSLVDLMGHPQIGGKTLLYLIDGLYAGKHASSNPMPQKWLTTPFNNDWPSSLFASQDPVAIDSVGFDFLYKEWPEASGPGGDGADDYLHEAALASDPCSGTFYDPNHDGVKLPSQGVHEHWNDANNMQYTRNLDPNNGTGIELVTQMGLIGDFDNSGFVDFNDFALLANAWRSKPGDANWNEIYDISTPSDGIIDRLDLAVFCENWLK